MSFSSSISEQSDEPDTPFHPLETDARSNVRFAKTRTAINSLLGQRHPLTKRLHPFKTAMNDATHPLADIHLLNSAVDKVAQLFDITLKTDRIPGSVQLLLARLQTPVIRAAIAAPQLFVTEKHPALMLISSMVACATGVKGSVMSAQELENGIKQAVMFIEQSSQLGSQAFVLAQQSLQAYLQAHSGAPAQAIRLSHFRKHQMPRVVHYTHVITEMLTGLSVRPEINSFLFNIWAEVLAVVASRHGKYHKETLALTKVVTDLIWASGSKATRRSRARVIKDMPPLLEKLRHGMTYLGLPQCRQNAHINVISAPLVDAFLSINPRIALTALSKQNQTTQPNDKTPPSRLMPSLHDDDEHAVEVLESHTDSDWSLFDPNLKQ